MSTHQVALQGSAVVAAETMAFEFSRPEELSYRAGQAIDLVLEHPAFSDEKGARRTFSLASAPHEETLKITTRMRDSAFKRSLKELEPDSSVTLKGPFGSFTLHERSERPAVFLAGGIGITPFMSMIADAAHRSLPHQISLFYSNRRPEDAAFLDTFQEIEKRHQSFKCIPTMTNMEQSDASWDGEQGYITMDMIDRYAIDREQAVYYLAGPQGMVTAMRDMLTKAGISEDDIKFEEFAGY